MLAAIDLTCIPSNFLMLRTCVIGLGNIGNLHADIYKADPLAELVGGVRQEPGRAAKAGARLGVPHFLDAKEMLAALQPDVCSVATGGFEYSSDHYEPTMIQALDAGCHVLGEKPISNDHGMCAGDGGAWHAETALLCHRLEPSLYAGRPHRQTVAKRGSAGRIAVLQHGVVDWAARGSGFARTII